jgi:hypothetical protein
VLIPISEEDRECMYAIELGYVTLPGGGDVSLEVLEALVSAWRAIYTGSMTNAKYNKLLAELTVLRGSIPLCQDSCRFPSEFLC